MAPMLLGLAASARRKRKLSGKRSLSDKTGGA
jgi:hypothetical protein